MSTDNTVKSHRIGEIINGPPCGSKLLGCVGLLSDFPLTIKVEEAFSLVLLIQLNGKGGGKSS